MSQGIRRVQLYDDRSTNFGAIINHYEDVYIDGEVLKNIRFGDLKDNKGIEFTDDEIDIISKAARKLVKDQDYNVYMLDFTTKKIKKFTVD